MVPVRSGDVSSPDAAGREEEILLLGLAGAAGKALAHAGQSGLQDALQKEVVESMNGLSNGPCFVEKHPEASCWVGSNDIFERYPNGSPAQKKLDKIFKTCSILVQYDAI